MKRVVLAILLLFHFAVCVNGQDICANIGKPYFRNFAAAEYKGHNRNFAVECDKMGRVFVANFEGLMVYDKVEWRIIHTPGISRLTCFYKSKNNKIWFGGNNVLGYIEAKDSIDVHFVVSDNDKELSFGEIAEVYERCGNICFRTSSNVAYIFKNDKISREDSRYVPAHTEKNWNGIIVNQTIDIADQGITVFATTNHGLVAVGEDQNVRFTLTTDDGLCSNTINAISYDGKGSIWGVTDNGIFVVYVSPVITHYSETDGLVGQVTSILTHKEKLYVGTLQGLFELGNDGVFSRIGNSELACWQLIKTLSGEVFASTADGLYKCSPEYKQITARHTLTVIEYDAGQFLTGELDGIYRCGSNGQSSKIANVANVVKFNQDKNGGVWAITLYNETFYKAPSSNSFVKKENKNLTLLFDYVDGEGDRWYTAQNNLGITCDELTEKERKWYKLLADHSVQAMEYLDGICLIGDNTGIIRFNVSKMNGFNPYQPVLYIRKSVIDGSNVQVTMSNDKEDPIGETLYSYRLQNDGKWSEWSNDKTLELNHLSAGKYNIVVRSIDAFGNIAYAHDIPVYVPMPLYARWYAILFYIFVIGAIVYLYFRWRLIRAKQTQEQLESLVDERTKELKDAQDMLIRQAKEATVGKLTKGLIDRILNPMNYINNFSHLSLGLTKDLSENLEDDKEKMTEDIYEDSVDIISMMKTNLEKIEQHGLSTTRILKAMEELLKDRSGNIEQVNLTALCKQNVDLLNKYNAEEISKYNIRVELEGADEVIANVNAGNMNKAIMSILINCVFAVVKKAQKVGNGNYQPLIKMSVSVSPDDNTKRLVFFDNGIGIEESIIDKVFDPFFTTKPTAEASGVGLYLTQQVIQDFKGTISVKSVKDESTEFIVILP